MMTERPCLQLTQDGRCSSCGNDPYTIDTVRNGRNMIERTCQRCDSYRIDPKEPLSQQKNDAGFILTQTS